MAKQMDREEIEKQQRMDFEKKMREYEDAAKHFRIVDWVEALLTVLITVIAVGGFSFWIAGLIEMVVEHKFVYWKAATNIFWATVFLGQWVYHLANMLMWKFK